MTEYRHRVTFALDSTDFAAAMRRASDAVVRAGDAFVRLAAAVSRSPRRDIHHPLPLAIDGAAYHRRRKARTRRNRRC